MHTNPPTHLTLTDDLRLVAEAAGGRAEIDLTAREALDLAERLVRFGFRRLMLDEVADLLRMDPPPMA